MKKSIKLFIIAMFFAPCTFTAASAASCSVSGLVRCLDSACAINVGANPAARCQLCGTNAAGNIPEDTGLKSISIGASSKTTLSSTELKSAPADAGARYAWAAEQCIKKLGTCTADDVAKQYDHLIEQSCKAAGIASGMAELRAAAKVVKSPSTCENSVKICLTDAKRCGADYSSCKENIDFDKFFSSCAVDASGCDDYVANIRTVLITARDNASKNQATLLANIAKTYQAKRESATRAAQESCTDSKAKNDCINSVCQTNMRNKCAVGFESEKSMATLLCTFHDTACQRLR